LLGYRLSYLAERADADRQTVVPVKEAAGAASQRFSEAADTLTETEPTTLAGRAALFATLNENMSLRHYLFADSISQTPSCEPWRLQPPTSSPRHSRATGNATSTKERQQAPSLPAFLRADLRDRRRVFLLCAVDLFPFRNFASRTKINNKQALMLQRRHTFKQKTSNTRVVIRQPRFRR
jgi:hypothetical protein